jgi:hypothetical protein
VFHVLSAAAAAAAVASVTCAGWRLMDFLMHEKCFAPATHVIHAFYIRTEMRLPLLLQRRDENERK